jgi:signal transduction histidine kinase
VYLATSDGLVRYNPENDNLKAIFIDGLPFHDQVYGMAVLKKELYVSTRNALCKLTGDGELIKILSYENLAGAGIPFLSADKLKLYVRDVLISMSFPEASAKASAYLSHIGFGSDWQYVGDRNMATFNYGVGSLQVLFGNNLLIRTDNALVVKYRFSGSSAWQLLTGSTILTGNLSYGKHKLEYYTVQWGKSGAIKTFTIEILRPWWATYYFYGLCALLAALGIWLFLKYKLKQKTESERNQLALILNTAEKERSRISRDFHDGVGTKLSSVKLIAESSKGNVNHRLLSKLPEIVDEIMVDIRNVINELSPPSLKQYGLGFALQSYINNLKNQIEGIEIHTEIADDLPRLDDAKEINVFRICQELLNNAIKHSGGDTLKLNVLLKHKAMQITVVDNGKGIDSTAPTQGHGMENIKSRVATLKGEMSITSVSSKGTEVKIILPLNP